MLRAAGASICVQIPTAVPYPFLDVRECAEGWIATGCGERGNDLSAWNVPNDAPRLPLDSSPELPPVNPFPGEVAPLIDYRSPSPFLPRYAAPTEPDPIVVPIGTLWCGLFNVDGYKYGPPNRDWRNYGGVERPWLYPGGNCVVITGEPAAAITASDKEVPRPAIICTGDAIASLAENDLWDLCAAIWPGGEAGKDPAAYFAETRDLDRYVMHRRGLGLRPFIAYSDTPTMPQSFVDLLEPDGQTWLGVQLYYQPGDGEAYLRQLAADFRRDIPRSAPVAFHMKCYSQKDRIIPVETLIANMFITADIVREWNADDPGSVKALLGFSDGRGHVGMDFGGLRFYCTEAYRAFAAIAAACQRPIIS
jgi:hypothetical protein